MTTQRFQVVFEAQTNRFRAAMRGVRQDVERFASRVSRFAIRGGLLGTAIGGAGVGAAAFGIGRTIDKLTEFSRYAGRIRQTPAVIQVLDRLAKVKGVDVDQLVESVEELQRTAGEGKYDLFEKIGLSKSQIKAVEKDALGFLALFADKLAELPLSEAIAGAGPIVGEDVARNLINLSDRRRLPVNPLVDYSGGPGQLVGESLGSEMARYKDQIERVGGALKISTDEVNRLRENWVRLTDLVELFGLKLAENLRPNIGAIADAVERWVISQGGLGQMAVDLIGYFDGMVGKTSEIIDGIHGMITAMKDFGESVSFGSTMAGRMVSDVGEYLGSTFGTAEGRQSVLDTIGTDFTNAIEAIRKVLPEDGYTRLVNAVESLIDPSKETAKNTRNPVARAQ